MRHSLLLICAVVMAAIISCGPSEEEKASARLNAARALLQKNDTVAALLQLDSIASLHPKAMYAVNSAQNLMNEINFDLLQKVETQLDSVQATIETLEKSFTTEKTQFDRYMQYIHKRQTFDRAWKRSYIQVHLDERGELYLSSNYHGEKWLNHYGLRVYDSGDAAKTDSIPVGDVDNHHSDFMDAKWEKVSYRNGKDNGVIEFIARHTDRNLKAVFLGQRYYYIILETYDKQAVKDALALSKAIKRRKMLQAELKRLQNKL